MARYRDGERRADQSPTQCVAAKDGFGGVVDVGWAVREAGDERGGSASHMPPLELCVSPGCTDCYPPLELWVSHGAKP